MTLDRSARRGDCLARGTRLATPDGWIAVEALQSGAQVRLAGGGSAPVVWVGRRRVDCRRHPQPHTVRPVRVARGAFADGTPERDLLLSPDHAVLANGVLIPVGLLINGSSITQEAWDFVEYFHIELPRHDVVLAEGLAVESYLDTGTRAAFEGAAVRQLYPRFARDPWDAEGCAPLALTGPMFQAVVRQLRARTRMMRATSLSAHRGGEGLGEVGETSI